MVDQMVLPAAQSLLTCLQTEILKNPNPHQHFQLRAGNDPVAADINERGLDYCCEGIVYVRIARRFPASNFPIADEEATACSPAAWGIEFEMGAFRCVPIEPDAQAWEDSVTNILNDQDAMAKAICCWVADQEANNPFFTNFMIRDWLPFVNQGGCTGGEMNILAQFIPCEGC